MRVRLGVGGRLLQCGTIIYDAHRISGGLLATIQIVQGAFVCGGGAIKFPEAVLCQSPNLHGGYVVLILLWRLKVEDSSSSALSLRNRSH